MPLAQAYSAPPTQPSRSSSRAASPPSRPRSPSRLRGASHCPSSALGCTALHAPDAAATLLEDGQRVGADLNGHVFQSLRGHEQRKRRLCRLQLPRRGRLPNGQNNVHGSAQTLQPSWRHRCVEGLHSDEENCTAGTTCRGTSAETDISSWGSLVSVGATSRRHSAVTENGSSTEPAPRPLSRFRDTYGAPREADETSPRSRATTCSAERRSTTASYARSGADSTSSPGAGTRAISPSTACTASRGCSCVLTSTRPRSRTSSPSSALPSKERC